MYAQRIKRDPTRSLMYEFDRQREEKVDLNDLPAVSYTHLDVYKRQADSSAFAASLKPKP